MATEHKAKTTARRVIIDSIAVPAATAPSRSELAGLCDMTPGELSEALGIPAVWRAVLRYHARALVEARGNLLKAMKRQATYSELLPLEQAVRKVLDAWAPRDIQRRFPETTSAFRSELQTELGRNCNP